MNAEYKAEEQIADTSMGRPHLVILGAGASFAACPEGDANGVRLPLMNDLIEKLSLGDELDAAKVTWRGQSFEDVYSTLFSDTSLKSLTQHLNERVRNYFAELVLPDEPNIYDYLVLGLRDKDVVATFNWDPFLWQALQRNRKIGKLPHFLFLHGCALIGHCHKHKQQGLLGRTCPDCRQPFTPTKMLYPVGDKDYVSDSYIPTQWSILRKVLETAYLLTIFGYSAPTSDKAAVDLMKSAWGSPEIRQFEEIEIIDIKSDDELADTWDAFIHTHHYGTTKSFFDSHIFHTPRRTCETMWQQLMKARFCDANSAPTNVTSLSKLQAWYAPLIDAEG